MNKTAFIFILLAAFTALAFADIVPSGFTISPSTFKPGVSGTLSFTLTNNGNRSISGVDLFPSGQSLSFLSDKTNVGTLGAGASTTVSIPFKVNSNAVPGVYNIQVTAYWIDVDGQGYKTFSYPLTVSSSVTFQVSSFTTDVEQIHPGEAFTVTAVIKNTGSAARNVRLSNSSTQFTFSGASQVVMGDLATGQESTVQLSLSASSSLTPGVYAVPLTVTYDDELGTTQMASLSISPVAIYSRSIYFSVSTKPSVDRILPGQRVNVTVTLSNVGTEEARFMKVSLSPSSSSFVLLNAGEKYIDSIPVGGSRNVSFELGVNSGTLPGFYPLRLSIDFADAKGIAQAALVQSTGLEVAGVSNLDIIAGASPAPVTAGKKHTLSLQISNIGTFQLKSVRVSISGTFFDVLVSPDSYIGTLNVDDYSTVTYPVYVKEGVEPGRHPFIATIIFRDSDNVERSITKSVYLDVVSAETAAKATGATNGTSIWVLLFGAAIVLVVLYFAYKRFFGHKKETVRR